MRPYLCWNSSRSPASRCPASPAPLVCRASSPAPFVCRGFATARRERYTGLSGMKKLIARNNAAGTVSAQNIQRQPQARFHAWLSATLVSLANSMFTTCAARIPSTMVIWFRLTILPRISVGLTSAIYIGESAEATPMPTPPMKRAILNNVKSLNKPVPMAETVKSTAANISNGFRPHLSAAEPATIAPARQPTRAVDMATPCKTGESLISKNSS